MNWGGYEVTPCQSVPTQVPYLLLPSHVTELPQVPEAGAAAVPQSTSLPDLPKIAQSVPTPTQSVRVSVMLVLVVC